MRQIRFPDDKTLESMRGEQCRARLWAWRNNIDALIEKYGEDASMFIDSGGNDSQLVIDSAEKE
jgi:hypothetical protein